MRKIGIILWLSIANLSVVLGQTDVAKMDAQAGDTAKTIFLPAVSLDTLLGNVFDEDAMLLGLVAKQSRELHANDTVWERYPHPLCMPLMYVPAEFPALMDTTKEDVGSIAMIRHNARRYITQNHADMYVSMSNPDRLKQVAMGQGRVRKALVNDVEADRLDRERALRNMSSPWRYELNTSLQITQNFATNNWYQGASNSFSMLASAKGYIRYKHENILWENNGEWRAGVSTVSGDSLRKVKNTDDVFRINSKFGYQVHEHWYVSAIGEFRTNLWNNWRANTKELSTSFLTPIRFTLGVGADYKPIKGLSVNIAPATYKLVYAMKAESDMVNVTDYGIEEGKNLLHELGSSVRVDWRWRPVREIIVDANFYFFTNYKRVETELELDVDFIINRYLSAKVMIHPRYDSTVELAEGQKNKLQFKELISIGFSHTFR